MTLEAPRYSQDVYSTQAGRIAEALRAAGVSFEIKSDFRITTFSVGMADKPALDRAIADVGDDD